jgi:septal ring factor EnvC (AmiA/AmiB activator)
VRLVFAARVASCAALCAAAVAWGVVATAQDERARREALAARAAARLEALHREADRLASQERTLLGELRKLEVDRQIRLEELKRLDADAADVERDLSATSERLSELQAVESAARPDLEARLVEIYKLGQARYARLLLSTTDVRQLAQAVRTAAALAQLDRNRFEAHQRTVQELVAARATLEERTRRLAALRADARKAEAEVARAARARSDAIRNIDRERDLNARLAGELQAAHQKLQLELRALGSGTVPAAAVGALPIKPFQGDLPWPAAGPVRRPFRPQAGAGPAASNGIEINAFEGADVTAIHDAVVAYADSFSGFGNLVILDHGAQAFSLYGYLLDIAVKKGARVAAGQMLGTVGPSLSGPAGLYFELRVDGQPADPLQWLKRR